jgi:hypothetical protein
MPCQARGALIARTTHAAPAAGATGDIAALERLLAADVAGCAGHGEVVHAARGPVREGFLVRVAV